jgi:hypothetical protein
VQSEPIEIRFGTVYHQTTAIPLPPQVVDRFVEDRIAVSSISIDMVRHNQLTGAEESVPLHEMYLHHVKVLLANDELLPSPNDMVVLGYGGDFRGTQQAYSGGGVAHEARWRVARPTHCLAEIHLINTRKPINATGPPASTLSMCPCTDAQLATESVRAATGSTQRPFHANG